MRENATIAVNRQIRADKVLLISPSGENLGINEISQALQIAEEHNLDLLEISPHRNGTLPVCKIADFSKFKYNKSKKQKIVHHNHSQKEVRVGLNTSDHDLQTKHKQIKKFLDKKHRVKYTMKLQGREMARVAEAKKLLLLHTDEFQDIATWEKPTTSGRMLSIILQPIC